MEEVIGKDVFTIFSFLTGDFIFARTKIPLFFSNKNPQNLKYSNKLSIFRLNQWILVIILMICAHTWMVMVPDLYHCLSLNYEIPPEVWWIPFRIWLLWLSGNVQKMLDNGVMDALNRILAQGSCFLSLSSLFFVLAEGRGTALWPGWEKWSWWIYSALFLWALLNITMG